MSNPPNVFRLHLAAVSAALILAHSAPALDIVKANNTTALDQTASWVGGTVPGPSDRGTWNSSSTGSGVSLGSSLAWAGIQVSSATPSPGAVITDPGSTTLTLGSSGITVSGSNNRHVTINPAVTLAAHQSWSIGSGSLNGITATKAIGGAFSITTVSALGYLGTVNLNAANTFSGGFTNGTFANVSYASSAALVASGGVLTSSPFGTGPLTINGGKFTAGTLAFFNPAVSIQGNFIWATTGRDDTSGNFNLGGATRTISLTRAVTPANVVAGEANNSLRFTTVTGGIAANTFTNGSLRIAADSSVVSPNLVHVTFGTFSGNNFKNNAGLILGPRVYVCPSSTGSPFGDKPAVTVEAGGFYSLCEAATIRSHAIFSLAGAGTVLNNGSASSGTGTLTIDGGGKATSSDFSGVIRNTDTTTFATATVGLVTALTKSGNTTQILSGNNTYTGPTLIDGGTLLINGNNSAATGPVMVTNGATLGGTGTIGGSTTNFDNGTIAPGSGGIGTLTFGTAPTLNGTLLMEIDRNGGSPLADKVAGAGALGGTLTVVNIGATLQTGDAFDLLDGSLSSSFATLNLPGGPSHWNAGSLNSSGTITFTGNNTPSAANFGLGVAVGGSVTAQVVGKYCSDADGGDTLTITSVSTPANGTATIVGGTNVTYTSTNSAASDSFTYTVSDGLESVTRTVSVTTHAPEGFNRLSGPTIIGIGPTYSISFLGIPNEDYALEETSSLTPPITWTPVVTNTVGNLSGSLNFIFTPVNPSGFFRTRHVP